MLLIRICRSRCRRGKPRGPRSAARRQRRSTNSSTPIMGTPSRARPRATRTMPPHGRSLKAELTALLGAPDPPGVVDAAVSPRARSRLAQALAAFCALTVVFLVPRDLFDPAAREVEVWFGLELHGRAALWTAPLHWALFAFGAWAFWSERPWVWRASAVYVFYIALSHVVWSETSPRGQGFWMGLAQATAFSVPGVVLWWRGSRAPGSGAACSWAA